MISQFEIKSGLWSITAKSSNLLIYDQKYCMKIYSDPWVVDDIFEFIIYVRKKNNNIYIANGWDKINDAERAYKLEQQINISQVDLYKIEKYYRICERKNDNLYTLFHKITTSRQMPLNTWLNAEIKEVWDGSRKTSKKYTSGFHVFEDPDECSGFISKFRKQRDMVMVECEIGNTWPKTHSRSNVLLTDKIKVLRIIKELKIKKWQYTKV